MTKTGYGVVARVKNYIMDGLTVLKFVVWPGLLYLAGTKEYMAQHLTYNAYVKDLRFAPVSATG